MNATSEERKDLDGIDILFLFWIMLLVLAWIGPALDPYVGDARLLLTEALLLLGVIAFLKYRRLPIRAACRWNSIPLDLLPYFILFALSGAMLLDGIDRLIGLVIPLPTEVLESYRKDLTASAPYGKVFIVLGAVLFAPIAEESIFRGAIQQTFEHRSNVTKGVLLTSLIFGLIHFQIAWLIQLLIMSVFLGWMTWRWESILPAILLHAANNFWSYWLLVEAGDKWKNFYLFHGQLNPTIAVTCFAIAFLTFKKLYTSRSPEPWID